MICLCAVCDVGTTVIEQKIKVGWLFCFLAPQSPLPRAQLPVSLGSTSWLIFQSASASTSSASSRLKYSCTSSADCNSGGQTAATSRKPQTRPAMNSLSLRSRPLVPSPSRCAPLRYSSFSAWIIKARWANCQPAPPSTGFALMRTRPPRSLQSERSL